MILPERPAITQERVDRWNRSDRKRAERDAPLLVAAGVVDLPLQTVESALEAQTAYDQRWAQIRKRRVRKARLLRHFVGLRVSPQRLAEMDHYWETNSWPRDYESGYWWNILADLIGREQPGVNPIVWKRKLERAYRPTFGGNR